MFKQKYKVYFFYGYGYKVIRKILRDDKVFGKVPVLSSKEQVIDTKEEIGSYSPVTMSAGIYLADYVIKEIIKDND